MSNVIQFPKKKEIVSSVDETTILHVDFLTEEIVQDIVEFFHDEGHKIDDEKYIFEVSLMYESLKSLISKLYDLYHPLQKFSSDVYTPFYKTKEEESIQLEFDFMKDD